MEQLAIDSEVAGDTGDGVLASDSTNRLNFLQAIYFATATFTTTGYGDYSPTTVIGQAICLIFMVWSIALIGSRISLVSDTIQSYRRDGGKYSRGTVKSKHVVVVGGHLNPAYCESMNHTM